MLMYLYIGRVFAYIESCKFNNLILCQIANISSKTVILIQQDNIFCRCTFIPGRFAIILSANLLIWSSVNLVLCSVDNILGITAIILIP